MSLLAWINPFFSVFRNWVLR